MSGDAPNSAIADVPQVFGNADAMTAGLSDRTVAQLRSKGEIEDDHEAVLPSEGPYLVVGRSMKTNFDDVLAVRELT